MTAILYRHRAIRLLLVALSVCVASGIMVLPASASTITYQRDLAAAYADHYSCNPPLTCKNTSTYPTQPSDCTNFVSQVLRAGGIPNFAQWAYFSRTQYSKSWTVVADFTSAFVNSQRASFTQLTNLSAAYTPLESGDVYVYDWGKGLGISHVAVEAGYGARASMYSSDGYGDYTDQHTTDRWHVPWNYGYLHPTSDISPSKMKIYDLALDSTMYF